MQGIYFVKAPYLMGGSFLPNSKCQMNMEYNMQHWQKKLLFLKQFHS